jgi:hypothetical protein
MPAFGDLQLKRALFPELDTIVKGGVRDVTLKYRGYVRFCHTIKKALEI